MLELDGAEIAKGGVESSFVVDVVDATPSFIQGSLEPGGETCA